MNVFINKLWRLHG